MAHWEPLTQFGHMASVFCVIRLSLAILKISQRLISFSLMLTVLFSAMSYSPPLGHFNFARIGHYYFALTPLIELL